MDDLLPRIAKPTPTFFILDNARIHHGLDPATTLRWMTKFNTVLCYIPPYSPELNMIEILWMQAKYHVASTPLSEEVARLMVDQYGSQANPSEMVTIRCDDVASLVSTTAQTDAIFLGVIAATRRGLEDGSLVELHLKPKLVATARFAYVTLAGRTEAPAMAYFFCEFVREHLHD